MVEQKEDMQWDLTYEVLAGLSVSGVLEEGGEDGDEDLRGVSHGGALSSGLASSSMEWAWSQALHSKLKVRGSLLEEGV